MCFFLVAQAKNLHLQLEQESHKRSLSQSELKVQNQQVSVLRSSEKQLKQELNHLLDTKQSLERQNQELRRSNQISRSKTLPSVLSRCLRRASRLCG